MDRLPFASEGVLSEVADMYPASHEGVLYKLIFHRGFSSCISGSSSAVQGEALVMGRVLPATSHPAGRYSHHDPAFGLGELQEGGTTL